MRSIGQVLGPRFNRVSLRLPCYVASVVASELADGVARLLRVTFSEAGERGKQGGKERRRSGWPAKGGEWLLPIPTAPSLLPSLSHTMLSAAGGAVRTLGRQERISGRTPLFSWHLGALAAFSVLLLGVGAIKGGRSVLLPGRGAVKGGRSVLLPGRGAIKGGRAVLPPGSCAIKGGRAVLLPGRGAIKGGRSVLLPGRSAIKGGRAVLLPGRRAMNGGRATFLSLTAAFVRRAAAGHP
jgi:hypothetical protein